MTEEYQVLVAKAALAGVKFFRDNSGYWCARGNAPRMADIPKFTMARAAAVALKFMGLMTESAWKEYDQRTEIYSEAQDVDITSLATALAGDLPDAATCADPELLPR